MTNSADKIKQNIANHKDAYSLAGDIADLLQSELPRLPSDESRQEFWQMMHDASARKLKRKPACLVVSVARKRTEVRPDEVEEALALVEDICAKADEVPEAGEEFAQSVFSKAEDIGENIEQHNRVTEAQMTALENMNEGLDKWFHD